MVPLELSVQPILDDLLALPPVRGAILLGLQGRVLASRLPSGVDPRSLAEVFGALFDLDVWAPSPTQDPVVRVDLRGAKGSTVLLKASPDAILAVLTSTRIPESLSIELTRAAGAIARAIR